VKTSPIGTRIRRPVVKKATVPAQPSMASNTSCSNKTILLTESPVRNPSISHADTSADNICEKYDQIEDLHRLDKQIRERIDKQANLMHNYHGDRLVTLLEKERTWFEDTLRTAKLLRVHASHLSHKQLVIVRLGDELHLLRQRLDQFDNQAVPDSNTFNTIDTGTFATFNDFSVVSNGF
jgi:hypothetical protein